MFFIDAMRATYIGLELCEVARRSGSYCASGGLRSTRKWAFSHIFWASNQSGMSITGAGTDCVQVLGVATLTMGHVACTDHVVWLAEAYRARYAAQPQKPLWERQFGRN